MSASNGHAARSAGIFDPLFAALIPPAAPVEQPQPPSHAKVAQPKTAVAEVLSPSQVWTLQDCAARWMFKYLWQLPDPKNGNLALGSAVDAALSFNFVQKIDSGADLPVAEVETAYDKAWREQVKQAEFRDDEDPAEIAAQGRALAALYMRERAPQIQPAPGGIQRRVEGVIAGVKVQGYIDIVERNARLRDIKTAAKKSAAATCSQKFQASTYTVLLPGASGHIAIDQLVKTKTPQLVTLAHEVNGADRAALERQYPLAQELARSGVYMPNRNSNLCNRRNCAHWRACQKEFGGEIPE